MRRFSMTLRSDKQDNKENHTVGQSMNESTNILKCLNNSLNSKEDRHKGISFSVRNTKITQPQPFSFAAREASLLRRKGERLLEAEREAKALANSFRARPMRVGSPDPLPEPVVRSPVHPKPFHFEAEERVVLRQSRRQMESSASVTTECSSSTSVKSPTVLHRPPFIPHRSEKEPTNPLSPKLSTSIRAKSRQEYEKQMMKRKMALEAELEAARLAQLNKEAEEIKRLRREIVHHPVPIRRYKSMRAPEQVPPTVPISPALSTLKRARGVKNT